MLADELRLLQRFSDHADKAVLGLDALDSHVPEIASEEGRAEARESIRDLKEEMAVLRCEVEILIGDAEVRDRVTAEMTTRIGLFQEQRAELQTEFAASNTSGNLSSEEPPTAENDSLSSLFRQIFARMRKMFRELWRIVVALGAPKEWTLKLKAGIADVEIKFGRELAR